MWRSKYEDSNLITKVDALWNEVKPLYNELHKYVRNQLRDLYPDSMNKKSDLIPAHLLGNMWVSVVCCVSTNTITYRFHHFQ